MTLKKTITIFTLVCAVVLTMTACNNKEGASGDIDVAASTLPVNTSNDITPTSTTEFEKQKPTSGGDTSNGTTSSDTGSTSAPSGSGGTSLTDVIKLVPDNGAMMDDAAPLGNFIINGIMFDITEPDLTPNVIGERVGNNFGYWGLGYDDYNSHKRAELGDDAGYQFYGGAFSYAGGSDNFYIEALDDNGQLITEWRYMTQEGELTYEDYHVKGIRYSRQSSPEFVTFTSGLVVGNQPEYYENILGKGYEVNVSKTDEDGYEYNHYRLSIYKTPSVTMVIEYREKQNTWYNDSITLIRNS